MKNLSFLFLILSVSAAWGGEKLRPQLHIVDGQSVNFVWFADQHVTISANCVNKNTWSNCDASRALTTADARRLAKDALGRNPGAMLCVEQFHGTVVISKDARGNERSFCRFADGSYLGSGSLIYYGRKKGT